jgi:hypothetical protein
MKPLQALKLPKLVTAPYLAYLAYPEYPAYLVVPVVRVLVVESLRRPLTRKDYPMSTDQSALDRREFLKVTGAVAVAGAAGLGSTEASAQSSTGPFLAAPPIETVRIGYVGIGGQGGSHVQNLLKIDHCRITAVCDIRPARTEWAAKQITAAGHPPPTAYTQGPQDFVRLCETEQLDLVYNATPWEFHVPIMLAAMKNGKHTATEVPAAMTLDDAWALVEGSEKYRKHCVLMENCNYDRPEMMVYNMVRKGLFGEILHAEGG